MLKRNLIRLQTGFGIEGGPDIRDMDFYAVRGDYDSNKLSQVYKRILRLSKKNQPG
jgi:hypothetical protein